MQDENITGYSGDGRRVSADRRVRETPLLPARRERRIGVERRLPVVDDLNVTFSEWVKSMALFQERIRRRARAKASARPTPKKW